jgi:integrase
MKRRGSGEGSIYQRGDGRWVATLELGWHDGRRVRHSVYGKTRTEVRERLARTLRELQDGVTGTRRETVDAYLRQWLEAVKPSVRASTFRRYQQLVDHQLVPRLGRTQLSALKPADVESMLRRLADDGLAPRTVHHARAVLRTALARAVRHGLIARNAAALAEPPRVERHEARSLSPDQVKRLLETLDGHPMRALITLALASGMRSGEIRGLQWRDMDWTTGSVTVNRSLQRIDGVFRAVEPKTALSRRTLPLPDVALAALRDYRQQQVAAPVSGAYIFTQADGQPLHPTTVWRALQRVLHYAGLPAMPFHALRHTAASLLLAQGTHPRVVMEMLGHSTIALTMNTYSHVIPALERDAANRMNAILSNA